jgi:DNA-directed RNA polymerase beta subunit
LVDEQLKSWEDFIQNRIGEVFKEFSPIEDYHGKKFSLEISK